MERLRRLDLAHGYTEMLQEVETLRDECAQQLGKSDEAALSAYKRLSTLATGLQPLSEAAEGAAPHLIVHVLRTTYTLRTQIEESLSADFEKTLTKMGWPKQGISVPPGLQQEWKTHIEKLLDLQKPELIAADTANNEKTSKDEPAVLLPIDIMMRPLELRFKYHFSGDRPTNRLDKPEYFLNHILDLINTYCAFFQTNMQPLLLAHFRGSDLALIPAYIDATSAFITALIPMLQRKLLSILPQLSTQPQLLSNLMHEVMSFDTTIQEEWSYTPLSPATLWRGLAHYILEKQSYFPRLLAVERDFALSRYDSIISDKSTGELDYDSVPEGSTKPSKAAIRVNDLLETITERYRTLSSFSQKLRFLMDVQIEIFDRFYQRLFESLNTFLAHTTVVGRTVHGVSKEEQAELTGVKGLDRLCRIFGSADYLEKAMRDWSDDVFFLELWEELQYRASSKVPIKGDLNMAEIASKTNKTISDDTQQNDELEGALFEETANSYRKLRVRSEEVICDTLTYDLRNALRPYTRINPWASLSSTTGSNESSLTAELDAPLSLLDSYLSFLAHAMAKASLRRISRTLAHAIQTTLWDSVLIRHSFSTAGAAQFVSDFRGICSVFDRYLGADAGRNAMKRFDDGLNLLALPVKGEIPVEVEANDVDVSGEKKWGLFEVERRVFIDNEAARDVLEEMGLEVISESDARTVLERRVELSS